MTMGPFLSMAREVFFLHLRPMLINVVERKLSFSKGSFREISVSWDYMVLVMSKENRILNDWGSPLQRAIRSTRRDLRYNPDLVYHRFARFRWVGVFARAVAARTLCHRR